MDIQRYNPIASGGSDLSGVFDKPGEISSLTSRHCFPKDITCQDTDKTVNGDASLHVLLQFCVCPFQAQLNSYRKDIPTGTWILHENTGHLSLYNCGIIITFFS